MNGKLVFKNFPKYNDLKSYTVVRNNDIEKWFYGTYEDRDKANNVALEINGEVWEKSEDIRGEEK